MEYGHRIMRGTVGMVVGKAIRDIRSDPGRSIRNLADMGGMFSTSPAQKRFFTLARSVLKIPGNPYKELLVRMTRDVSLDSLTALSLNFGYTALVFGAQRLRRYGEEMGRKLPWLLCFGFTPAGGKRLSPERLSALISEAVSFGIYTFIFVAREAGDFRILSQLCQSHAECVFFLAVAPDLLLTEDTLPQGKIPNLVTAVEVTADSEPAAGEVFQRLRGAGRFFGYYAFYREEDLDALTSREFTRRMADRGCLIGSYVNADPKENVLEDRVYRFACAERGKKGEPLFALDFYRDSDYVGDSISCGSCLCVRGDGSVPGCSVNLEKETLREAFSACAPRA